MQDIKARNPFEKIPGEDIHRLRIICWKEIKTLLSFTGIQMHCIKPQVNNNYGP